MLFSLLIIFTIQVYWEQCSLISDAEERGSDQGLHCLYFRVNMAQFQIAFLSAKIHFLFLHEYICCSYSLEASH